jgi:NADPH:quinone reductase-like Zn-dependent oxidoreductase
VRLVVLGAGGGVGRHAVTLAAAAGHDVVSALTRRLARALVEDKEGEHAVLAATRLAWTEVRPPRLVEREASGWSLTTTAPGPTARRVAKADVAAAMLALAASHEWAGRSPYLVARRG